MRTVFNLYRYFRSSGMNTVPAIKHAVFVYRNGF